MSKLTRLTKRQRYHRINRDRWEAGHAGRSQGVPWALNSRLTQAEEEIEEIKDQLAQMPPSLGIPVYDDNDQFLGELIDIGASELRVFVEEFDRLVVITINDGNVRGEVGPWMSETNNPNNPIYLPKYNVKPFLQYYTIFGDADGHLPGQPGHYFIDDEIVTRTLNYAWYNGTAIPYPTPYVWEVAEFIPIELPFTTPIALPVKLGT